MKVCPVCKSLSFDDAEVCYGCLYRFAPEDARANHADAPSLRASKHARARADAMTLSSQRSVETGMGPLAPSRVAVDLGDDSSVSSCVPARSNNTAASEASRDKGMTVSNPCRIVLSVSEDGSCTTISIETHPSRIASAR